MSSLRIGVVGGGGWLGVAVVQSLLDAGVVQPQDLSLSYRRERPTQFPDALWTTDNQVLADCSDVIILSVRPADWPSLVFDAGGKLVISVMAGIPLAAICEHHNTRRVVRCQPNAAAEVAKSYTPWIPTSDTNEEDCVIVRAIFDACGIQDQVGSERDIDYMTGLAGSGPAFPALLAAAMMNDAIAHGLPRGIAQRAVNTVLVGAAHLLEGRDKAPDDIVEAFVRYRGTTAAAIETMRAAGFDSCVAAGLAAAFKKSLSMGSDS